MAKSTHQHGMGEMIKKSHRGRLHKALGIPEGEPIPAHMLEDKPGDSEHMKEMKRFARNAKHFSH